MSQTSPTPATDAEVLPAERPPRRVGGVAAAAFLVALFNGALGVATEELLCVPDPYTVDYWAMWIRVGLVALAVVLGGWAVVRGPSRWLGAVAVVIGLLQGWWFVNDLFNWICSLAL